MNKLALGAAIVLAAALLALPAVVGSTTEARVRERVAAIDASQTAAATVVSYDRGWFRSRARLELRFVPDGGAQLPGAADALAGGALPIAVELAHGPIAVLDGVHFGWSKLIARPDREAPGIVELEQTLGVPHVFEFRGRSSYLGGLVFDADAPPFVLPVDEALLTFSGATLAGTFANRHLDADAHVNAVEFTSPTGGVSVRGVFASVDNELRSQYVLPGRASLTIESVAVTDGARGNMPVFETEDLSVKSDVALDAAEELLAMRVDYAVQSLRIEDNRFTNAEVSLDLRNVDVAVVEAYRALVADTAGTDPAMVRSSLGPHLERALRASPSMTFEPIRFRYDDEPFDGRLALTTNAARLPPAGTLAVDNPLLLLGLVNADASMRVSKPLASDLATLASRLQLAADDSIPPDQLDYMAEAQSGLIVAMLVGQGMLIDDGSDYRCSFELRDGTLTLNGEPLPFGL